MAATPEQRETFGARIRELRTARDLKQSDVCDQLERHNGEYVTPSAYSEYERGISAPSHLNVRALEDLFEEPRGSLGELLAYRDDDPGMRAELAELKETVRQQGETLALILRRLDRRGGSGSRR